jgi:hypothetical protein
VFHVELRQFPNATRAFNLTREELDRRIIHPWVAGQAVPLNDRRWLPDKARLTIYEGPPLETEQLGLGRGWATVTKSGENVTERLLSAIPTVDSELERLKDEVVKRAGLGPLPVSEALSVASEYQPGWRVSDRLALAERAVWELLHRRRVRLVRAGEPVANEEWEPALLAWETWAEGGVSLEALPEPAGE